MNIPENGTERISGRRLELKLAWNEGRLQSLDVDWIGAEAETTAPRSVWGEQLRSCLVDYENDRFAGWPDLPLAWEKVGGFRRSVLEILRQRIGYGALTTYGALAAMAGSPGAARAAGSAMAGNPWSLVVP